jgi:hypothetical protein
VTVELFAFVVVHCIVGLRESEIEALIVSCIVCIPVPVGEAVLLPLAELTVVGKLNVSL